MKFLIFFVLFNCIIANKNTNSLIHNTCKEASLYAEPEPNYYDLCITSINENPESQKVRNIDDLIVVTIKNGIKNMTNMKGIVEKILKEKRYKSKLSEKLLRDCLKLYSEGNGWLKKAIEYIKLREYGKVDDTTSDARVVPRTCEMGFNGDNNQTSPVTKENDVLFEMLDIPKSFNYNAHRHSFPP